MLSYYLFCGLVAGAAMAAIGLIGRSLPSGSGSDVDMRSLAVLMAAFATGLGIIAVVIGMLVLFVDTSDDAAGMIAALAVLVPLAVLGLPGLWLSRPGERTGVRGATATLLMFGGIVGLPALMTGVLAVLLVVGEGSTGFDPLVALLAIVGAAAALGVGFIGARGVTQLATPQPESVDVMAVRSRAVLLAAISEGDGVLALTAVLALFFIG